MSNQESFALLEQTGALITNSHLVYTSGRHGSSYVNKDALYPHIRVTSKICALIAAHFVDSKIDVVAGPTVGGVIMSQWVAHHLERLTGRSVLAIYAEEESNETERQRVFRRGYGDLLPSRRVLVVEDVLTTGGSARLVITAVQRHGGIVVGLGALCNRGRLTASALGVTDFYALADVPLESWAEADCPLCSTGVAINTKVGKGAAFLARKENPLS